MRKWAKDYLSLLGDESFRHFNSFQKDLDKLESCENLRGALLDFIADFANWDNSTNPKFLETSWALTQVAHQALGGAVGTRPLVIDPFAGGGTIPLEVLRIGGDAFASDINPVAVLLNKAVLEYIRKHGLRLLAEVHKWSEWIMQEAETRLTPFHPKDVENAMAVAYIWARTVLSEAPGDGNVPVEVPLIRSLWLARKKGRNRAFRWVRDRNGHIQCETVTVAYSDGAVRDVLRPQLEIFEPRSDKEVPPGTVTKGAATCPVTGYTTPVTSVRRQLKQRRGGTADSRLLCVVTERPGIRGRFYRVATNQDWKVAERSTDKLEQQRVKNNGSVPLIPDEILDIRSIRRISPIVYGMERWSDYFTPRQLLSITTFIELINEAGTLMEGYLDHEMVTAVQSFLALVLDRCIDKSASLVTWTASAEQVDHVFARQALAMVWDFVEANLLSEIGWKGASEWVKKVIEANQALISSSGQAEQSNATAIPLPDYSADAIITDPPYYDAVPYAYLSEFFYVWLRRSLGRRHPELLGDLHVPINEEIVVDRLHALSPSEKGIDFYEGELTKAFAECRRVLSSAGIATIVFASKTTSSWEAVLRAIVDAGWTITASWPIDTEREARMAAQGQARLGSSIHIVCRPRQLPCMESVTDGVGDWRDVLQELPKRIHEWMPRLAVEGIVGADAIFACLGPALEIFSRHSRVEKANGEQVNLKEYLEHVWAAVSREALAAIFEDGDASGFEEDARLTVIWFWVLKEAANGHPGGSTGNDEDEDEDSDVERVSNRRPLGYPLEFDAARKLAQGLGASLDRLGQPGGIVTIKGATATLNSIGSRERFLLGTQMSFLDEPIKLGDGNVYRGEPSIRMKAVRQRKPTLFDPPVATRPNASQWMLPGFQPVSDARSPMQVLLENGATVLDRLHQAMLLFGRSQDALLRPLLDETRMATNQHFWRLAQALSALYPPGSEEKRWVDGLLARKKHLGL